MKTEFVWLGLVVVCSMGPAVLPNRADTNELVAAIQPDGSVSVAGQATVPAYGLTGKWTELPGKSSDQHLSRHFMFLIPNQSPAMELYLTRSRTAEKPDGLFEIGLVDGYANSFAAKAGFTVENLAFEDCTIGGAKAKRTKVKLTRDQRTLWIYAYIFAKPTSLTFLTVRTDPDVRPSIERYLGSVQFR